MITYTTLNADFKNNLVTLTFTGEGENHVVPMSIDIFNEFLGYAQDFKTGMDKAVFDAMQKCSQRNDELRNKKEGK